MDSLESTTARLRRTFAYPADSTTDSEQSAPEALDEQEQEELITALHAQNETSNALFRKLLLALPAVSAVPYLIMLFRPGPARFFVAVLALTSLGSTAWMLYALAPGETGIAALDAWASGGGGGSEAVGTGETAGLSALASNARRRRTSFSYARERKSPLQQFLPYMNIGLCALVMVTGWLGRNRGLETWGHIGLGYLPAVVYGVVIASKVLMGSVDPERELSALKYEYKGA